MLLLPLLLLASPIWLLLLLLLLFLVLLVLLLTTTCLSAASASAAVFVVVVLRLLSSALQVQLLPSKAVNPVSCPSSSSTSGPDTTAQPARLNCCKRGKLLSALNCSGCRALQ